MTCCVSRGLVIRLLAADCKVFLWEVFIGILGGVTLFAFPVSNIREDSVGLTVFF